MTQAEINEQLRNFLRTEFPNQGVDLTDTTDLLEEWFVDSLGIIETVMFIEKKFGVEVSRADINGSNFKDLASLAGFVARSLNP